MVAALAAVLTLVAGPGTARAQPTLPAGFEATTLGSGITAPVNVATVRSDNTVVHPSSR